MSQQSTADDVLFVIVITLAVVIGIAIVIAWLMWSTTVFGVVTGSAVCYWYFLGGKHNDIDPDNEERN